MQKEWANKDRYRLSSGVPEPRVASLPRGEGNVRTIARGPRVLPARGVPSQGRVGVQVHTLSLDVVSSLDTLLLMVYMRL